MTLGPHDLVLARDKSGSVTAAGFPVNSQSVTTGQPALILRGGSKHAVRLEGLAIPAGLASSSPGAVSKRAIENAGVAPDALVEQLLLLASPSKATRPSRRRRKKERRSGRKTRRAA